MRLRRWSRWLNLYPGKCYGKRHSRTNRLRLTRRLWTCIILTSHIRLLWHDNTYSFRFYNNITILPCQRHSCITADLLCGEIKFKICGTTIIIILYVILLATTTSSAARYTQFCPPSLLETHGCADSLYVSRRQTFIVLFFFVRLDTILVGG